MPYRACRTSIRRVTHTEVMLTDEQRELDPQEVIEQPDYVAPESDNVDGEVTDPDDPNFVEPVIGASKPRGLI